MDYALTGLVALIIGFVLGWFFFKDKPKRGGSPEIVQWECDETTGDIVFVFHPHPAGDSQVTDITSTLGGSTEPHTPSNAQQTLRHPYNSASSGTLVVECTYSLMVPTSEAVDACQASGSGSATFIQELANRPDLQVTVPDGPHQGIHTAKSVSEMTWKVEIGGVEYTITSDSASSVVIRSSSSLTASKSIASTPFSATFPGEPFQASGEVLVTVA